MNKTGLQASKRQQGLAKSGIGAAGLKLVQWEHNVRYLRSMGRLQLEKSKRCRARNCLTVEILAHSSLKSYYEHSV